MDVRAWIVEDEKICLVRGQGEDSWALPGGFGEVGYSPTENILKEIEEETGFKAKVERLLAVLIPIVSNYRVNNMQSLF